MKSRVHGGDRLRDDGDAPKIGSESDWRVTSFRHWFMVCIYIYMIMYVVIGVKNQVLL